jgi:multisubunit Na+/H+ antiporter MnhE subunit
MRPLAVWLALLALWLALAGSLAPSELVAGALAAAAAVGAAEVLRGHGLLRAGRPGLRWAPRLAGVAVAVVRDFATVASTLVRGRRPRGAFRELPRPDGPRGLVALAASAAPNDVAVEIDDEREVIVVHRLVL